MIFCDCKRHRNRIWGYKELNLVGMGTLAHTLAWRSETGTAIIAPLKSSQEILKKLEHYSMSKLTTDLHVVNVQKMVTWYVGFNFIQFRKKPHSLPQRQEQWSPNLSSVPCLLVLKDDLEKLCDCGHC